MKRPGEISILQFARESAAILARRFQIIAVVALLFIFGFYMWNHYDTKISYLTDAVGSSMAAAIIRGDQGILNNFADSITQNGDIDAVWVVDEKSNQVVGFASQVFNKDFLHSKERGQFIINNGLYRLSQTKLQSHDQGKMGYLYLAIQIPVMGTLAAMTALGAVGWLVFGFFVNFVEKRVRDQLTRPVLKLAEIFKSEDILDSELSQMSRFKEINVVIESFVKLWFDKQRSVSLAEKALKDSVRGKIASFAAHDIRQKLHNAWSAIESLKSKEAPQREIEVLSNALSGIDGTVQDIRSVDLANVNTEAMSPHSLEDQQKNVIETLSQENIRPNLLLSIIEPLCREFQTKCDSNTKLKLSYTEFDLFAEVDSAKLNRVISNLLSNAFKAVALNSNGGAINVSIESPTGEEIVIEIKDNGPGVDKNQLEDIFGQSHFPNGGTGKGLVQVRENVERWLGHLEIETEKEAGFVARITLPRTQDTGAYSPGIFLSKNSDLLVIDDDEMALGRYRRKFESHNLQAHGIQCHYFADRPEAHSWLEKDKNEGRESYYFLDYRLKAGDTGTQIAQDFHIEGQALIVSDAWDDPETVKNCTLSGLPLLSKRILGIVPFFVDGAQI